jgi:hypothetical protein
MLYEIILQLHTSICVSNFCVHGEKISRIHINNMINNGKRTLMIIQMIIMGVEAGKGRRGICALTLDNQSFITAHISS